MQVLVAEDDKVSRKVLRALLTSEGYDVIETDNGVSALQMIHKANRPLVGLIDWEMPEMEGVEVCRQARLSAKAPPLHLILLTARNTKSDIITGLQTGANDYVVKPFDRTELIARVKIGEQIVNLQSSLTQKVDELSEALTRVKQLSGLLPICSYCKKIRDDHNYWTQVESYVTHHSEAQFSHSICPQCYEDVVKPEMIRLGIDPIK